MEISQQIKTIEEILGESYGKIPIIENNQRSGLLKELGKVFARSAARLGGRNDLTAYDPKLHSIFFDISGWKGMDEAEYKVVHELMHGYIHQRNPDIGTSNKEFLKAMVFLDAKKREAFMEKHLVLKSVDEGIADYVSLWHLLKTNPKSEFVKKKDAGLRNTQYGIRGMSETEYFARDVAIMRNGCANDGDINTLHELTYEVGYPFLISLCDGKENIGPIISALIKSPPTTWDALEESVNKFYDK